MIREIIIWLNDSENEMLKDLCKRYRKNETDILITAVKTYHDFIVNEEDICYG